MITVQEINLSDVAMSSLEDKITFNSNYQIGYFINCNIVYEKHNSSKVLSERANAEAALHKNGKLKLPY